MEESVYVTGFSGRFPPGCSSVADFWEYLTHGKDFPAGDVDMTIMQQQRSEVFLGHHLEPNSPPLSLLQVIYEAISDASYCQDDLKDTNTGVYTSLNMPDAKNTDENPSSAEQISALFGLRGPAVMVNAGCHTGSTGGLVALDLAVHAIRSGVVSRALVVDGDWTTSAREY